jgi:hypothetical protein
MVTLAVAEVYAPVQPVPPSTILVEEEAIAEEVHSEMIVATAEEDHSVEDAVSEAAIQEEDRSVEAVASEADTAVVVHSAEVVVLEADTAEVVHSAVAVLLVEEEA